MNILFFKWNIVSFFYYHENTEKDKFNSLFETIQNPDFETIQKAARVGK